MKIIALRHGLRFDSALFFTPLTKEGLIQADNLVEILKDIARVLKKGGILWI